MEMPHDRQAEIAVLGAMLNDEYSAEVGLQELNPEDFYTPLHRQVFESALSGFETHSRIDDFIVHDAMTRLGYGDKRYDINQIAAQSLNAGNIETYCRILKSKTAVRSLFMVSQQIQNGIANNQDSRDIINATCGKIDDIHARLMGVSDEPSDLHDIAELVADEALNSPKRSYLGLPTGLADCSFDILTGGVQRQHYWVLAARTSVGKSTLVGAITAGVKQCNPDSGDPLILSTEMSLKGMGTKGLAGAAGVHTRGLMMRDLTEDQRAKVSNVIEKKVLAGVKVGYLTGASVSQVRAIAKRHKRKYGLPLLVVDLASQLKARGGTQQEQLSAISGGLAALKVELDCCIIACVQLSRAVFTKDDNRPELHHLKGSGSWEEDADKVLFIHRTGYYGAKDNRTEIIQAKDRDHGKVDSIFVEYDSYRGQYTSSQGD